MLIRAFRAVNNFDHRLKWFVLLICDLIMLTVVAIVIYYARYSTLKFHEYRTLYLLLIAPVLSIISLSATNGYRSAARYQSQDMEAHFILALSVASILWGFVILVFGAGFPRTVILMYWAFSILSFIAWRRLVAYLIPRVMEEAPKRKDRRRAVVLGAGPVGAQLARELHNQGYYRVVAFLDDEPSLVHRRVLGSRVYPTARARQIIADYGASKLLIAKPEMRRHERRDFIRSLSGVPVGVKTVPTSSDLASGRWEITEVRDVPIEELLGREPVQPSRELIGRSVVGKTVLVTGAGGSIGSELVRQIAIEQPAKLILFDSSEFALFESRKQLQAVLNAAGVGVETHCVIGTILDESLVRRIMTLHRVETVFHAAAYKHVRLVEENSAAAVMNNVFGTLTLARCASACGVGLFLLISTDKAVRPTSVMGATKRVAELVIQALAARQPRAVFTMVRFGNVLGSSGSVIPIFKEQITRGGPVTVTHPDVTRYFMLIPEAAQLVIQAAGLACGGDVFLLEMGEPVKIADLARSMINLAGLDVREEGSDNGDIAIQFTGLLPGEKLFEELLIDKHVIYTEHPRIYKSEEKFLAWAELEPFLDKLKAAALSFDEIAIRSVMETLVKGTLRVDDIASQPDSFSAATGSYGHDLPADDMHRAI